MKELQSKKLKYIAGVAKNRKVSFPLKTDEKKGETRWDQLAKRLKAKAFTVIQLDWEVPKTRWVGIVEVERSVFWETKTIAIVTNAASLSEATEVDYLITNALETQATGEGIITTYLKYPLGGSVLPWSSHFGYG